MNSLVEIEVRGRTVHVTIDQRVLIADMDDPTLPVKYPLAYKLDGDRLVGIELWAHETDMSDTAHPWEYFLLGPPGSKPLSPAWEIQPAEILRHDVSLRRSTPAAQEREQ